MRTRPLLLLAASIAVFTAGTAMAQQVYKWTDARGVTHYSQTPPRGQRYTQRSVNAPGPASKPANAPGAATAQAAAPTTANPACQSARDNISTLQGAGPVQMDSNGDGQPDTTLDPAGRQRQLELARAFLAANCGGQ